MAGGYELGFEVLVSEAVHLSSLRPHVELLALAAQSDGGHALLQLDLPNEGGRRQRTSDGQKTCSAITLIFIICVMCTVSENYTWRTYLTVSRLALEHTAKVPEPEPTSKSPDCMACSTLTPCTDKAGNTEFLTVTYSNAA